MSGPIFAIDQQDVGIAVVVVVDEGAARAHGFRQPLLSEGAVVVGEMNSGLRGDVAESDLLGERLRAEQDDMNHRDTETWSESRTIEFSGLRCH